MLPKISTYVKGYDGKSKWMYFLIEDDNLFEKYNAIWYKVSADIKEEFDSKSVYNEKLLNTKINFHDKEMPKKRSNHHLIMLLKNENYYQQVLSKDCKCILKSD